MIKPKKQRLYKVTELIKFTKSPSDWFCVYDGKYIRQYKGETINKDLVLPMRRHLDELFNEELAISVFDRYDAKSFVYTDVLSLATFRARMKELKAK
jgi:hypothetical protein